MISVIIPVYNEEQNLDPLLGELEGILKTVGQPFEVICVDDKSTDGSLAVLRRLKEQKSYLRIVRHNINSGESAAGATGFAAAKGDIIITMDADQQNDPADIPGMLERLGPDVAAVCGVRRRRQDDWIRRLSSRIANGFRNWVTGDQIADAGCTFRALRRESLRELPVFNGLHRFLPTILRFQGYTVVEMEVNHRPRTRGQSKYGVHNRLWRGLRDCCAMRWYHARALPGRRMEPES
jgi:dolichol-phosphate mannosyltransferase